MTLMAPVEAGVDLQIKPLARMAGGFFIAKGFSGLLEVSL
jgi:hypothetical protein